MKTRKYDTRWMVSVALMAAIVVLLANTPLGLIPLPIIKATTTHIPVIVGAILLGPLAGGILGGVFGICSMINNTIAPAVLSFAFSPVMAEGPVGRLWVPDYDRRGVRLALDWAEKGQGERLHRLAGGGLCRGDDQYSVRHGQHLFSAAA